MALLQAPMNLTNTLKSSFPVLLLNTIYLTLGRSDQGFTKVNFWIWQVYACLFVCVLMKICGEQGADVSGLLKSSPGFTLH